MVSIEPLCASPGLVCQDSLDKQHIRQSVSGSLVDKICQAEEDVPGVLLSRRGGFMVGENTVEVLTEENGAVAIGLEIDAHVVAVGSVVEVLDTSVGGLELQLQGLLHVSGGSAVGIGSLYDTNVDLLANASLTGHLSNERGSKRCNAIAVEEAEGVLVVIVVVNDAISISVQRAAALVGRGL